MLGLSAPSNQICSLSTSELERKPDLVDRCRNEDIALGSCGGFALHPLRLDRVAGPKYDDALRGIQLALDRFVEGLTGKNPSIPPDRPPERGQRAGQSCRALAIFSCVADKNVCHRCPRRARRSTLYLYLAGRDSVCLPVMQRNDQCAAQRRAGATFEQVLCRSSSQSARASSGTRSERLCPMAGAWYRTRARRCRFRAVAVSCFVPTRRAPSPCVSKPTFVRS